ncbi:MAG: GatB/YqeY domain-containing protein [Alphaproteobacteria bacterium]|nr:GatB/YqeY domain-containing protein [Alphaproteobacteria bacterium]
MLLHARILADAARAAKGGDALRRDTLRLLIAALHNREIEKKGKGEDPALTDADVMAVAEREVKKRREAIEFFEKGNRPEQAAKERGELAVLEGYLPAALSDAELEKLVDDAIRTTGASEAKEMGRVMGAFRQLAEKAARGARVESAAVAAKVKAKLGAS